MKKIMFALTAGVLLLFSACETKIGMETSSNYTESEQKNLDAFNTVNKAFDTGETASLDSVVADDFLDHTDRGDIKSLDSMKAMVTMMHNTMKDMKQEVIHSTADGDYVYGWMRYTGTTDGSMGMPAGPYDMQAIELVKFNSDNKATEHWSFMEMQDVMGMMGGGAPPAMKDSTMK
jgi:predicted SnoaL-like aldol condensation-catalyzing enzyme